MTTKKDEVSNHLADYTVRVKYPSPENYAIAPECLYSEPSNRVKRFGCWGLANTISQSEKETSDAHYLVPMIADSYIKLRIVNVTHS